MKILQSSSCYLLYTQVQYSVLNWMCNKEKNLHFSLKMSYVEIWLHCSTGFFSLNFFFKPETFSVLKRLLFIYIIPWSGVYLIICLNVIVWTWIDRSCSISGLAFAVTQRVFPPVALRTFIGNMLHLMEILLTKMFTTKNKWIFGKNQ